LHQLLSDESALEQLELEIKQQIAEDLEEQKQSFDMTSSAKQKTGAKDD
jgi:hypothetical protein